MTQSDRIRVHLSADFRGDLPSLCAALSERGRWCAGDGRFLPGRRWVLYEPSPTTDARAFPLIRAEAEGTVRRATIDEVVQTIRPFLRAGVVTIEATRSVEGGCEIRERIAVHARADAYHLLIERWPADHRGRRTHAGQEETSAAALPSASLPGAAAPAELDQSA